MSQCCWAIRHVESCPHKCPGTLAVKTSIVMEQTFGRADSEIYWTSQERSQFAIAPHRQPPDTRVLLGAYSGTTWEARLDGGKKEIAALGAVVTEF